MKRSIETLFESSREDARLRVAQTNVVSRHLRRIFTATKALKHSVLADRDLETLGIKLSELDLEGARSPEHETFYQPLPKSELPEIDWDKVHFSEWHEGRSHEPLRVHYTLDRVFGRVYGAWLCDDKQQTWVPRRCYRANPRIASGEHTPDFPYPWQAVSEMEADSLSVPHCSFQMYHYADPEEPLRRSEILPIVGFMRWRLNRFDYIKHRTFPVMVISIFRSQARILQAYHDGKYLRISKSKFVDFTENSRENYELFVRWICSIPCGDTQAPLAIKGEPLPRRSCQLIDKGFDYLAREAEAIEAYHQRKKVKG
ncbi:hypothetical protein AbraIFM66950_011010 [Aspergillus brasiliensis]|nr:hypothetical protein AbraIFM66950_011010 [Aspergillus brasiliensis]